MEPSTIAKSATEVVVQTIGLDIAKNTFSVRGFDADEITGITVEFR
jgi:hypothetical protein